MCKVSNDYFAELKSPQIVPLSSWTLTGDDYLVALNANSNALFSGDEGEFICFICY